MSLLQDIWQIVSSEETCERKPKVKTADLAFKGLGPHSMSVLPLDGFLEASPVLPSDRGFKVSPVLAPNKPVVVIPVLVIVGSVKVSPYLPSSATH